MTAQRRPGARRAAASGRAAIALAAIALAAAACSRAPSGPQVAHLPGHGGRTGRLGKFTSAEGDRDISDLPGACARTECRFPIRPPGRARRV